MRFSGPVSICLLTLLIGLHWTLMQSVAWVGMFVSFVRTDPIPTAIEKTFSGENPCDVCKMVAEGKRTETSSPSIQPDTRIDPGLLPESLRI